MNKNTFNSNSILFPHIAQYRVEKVNKLRCRIMLIDVNTVINRALINCVCDLITRNLISVMKTSVLFFSVIQLFR